MQFVQEGDVERCMGIVKELLTKENVSVDYNTLKEITVDIMNISYSKGGDYSDKIISSYAETYIEHGFYKQFINR